MDHATHLALVFGVFRILTQGIRVVGAAHLHNFALIVAHHIGGANHIAITQPHPITQHQTLEFLVGLFPEILPVDVNLASHRHLASAHGFVLWVHRRHQ